MLHTRTGSLPAALSTYRRSLELAVRVQDHQYTIDGLLCRSEAHLRAGRPELARADAEQALARADAADELGRQAAAWRQIGKAPAAAGDSAGADRAWAEAASLFHRHGGSHERMIELFLAGDDPTLPRPP